MKAIVQDVYGTADVLELRDVVTPEVGDDEVLVRVHAAGVDRGVWHLMTGLPYLVRIAGVGLRRPKTKVRGSDVAGTVEAVGTRVTRFRPGDEVMGTCDGSFAEYAAAPEVKLAPKPAGLTFEQAAAVPVSGSTALQAVRDQGRIHDGDRVLILGASGGVGTFAVQLAKAFGGEVTGVCSTAKVDLVRSLGADDVVDYTRDDPTDRRRCYDLILDIGGNRPVPRLRRALTDRGTLVIVGGEGGGRWFGGLQRPARALVTSPFVRQRLRTFVAREHYEQLLVLTELVNAGRLTPVVDRTYPLSEAPEAIRYLESGHARGKVVVSV
ncbi:MAG TPA: NAD(P)-dependent alcohol dehydrogenase [Actinomycetospora sp.]|nr:NAD(P)-dependent alcohol dehydrogenase [Actinomycetospora sp.]